MDLTQEQPRSGSLKLGDWPWLPRMIDKARAKYQGNIGDYTHPCGRDRMLLSEMGVTSDEFRDIIERTETDEQVLDEVEQLRAHKEVD